MVDLKRVCVIVIPGETFEDFTKSPDLLVEMWAMLGKRGDPLYQMAIHDLSKSGQPTRETPLWIKPEYESDLYTSPHFASTDYYANTYHWIDEEEYTKAVRELSGRLESLGEG